MTLQEIFTFTPAQVSSKLTLIPLFPLIGAIINGFFGRRLKHERAAFVANVAVLSSFVVSAIVFLALAQNEDIPFLQTTVYKWFAAGKLDVTLGLLADHLSGVLLLVITGIGSLIHLYSAAYMSHDEHSWRYFAYLNLFVSAMLLLVLGDNLVTLFVGWEGVGLCSYLLIGFWFVDEAKAAAGRKAFIANRVGDFAFLLGMFTLFSVFGTLNVQELKARTDVVVRNAPNKQGFFAFDQPMRGTATGAFSPVVKAPEPGKPFVPPTPYTFHFIIGIALLCLFIGATGKSAQIPLYVWLPDAMAGPTPVSALIHAATMVTAGVYMMGRLSFMYVWVPEVLAVAGIIGVATSLFAALMAFAQNDIKKVLAYSTVSQLGYMFVGVGSGAFVAGTYHLFPHACFKACLFLGSGAVIHGLHEEQDIRRMGGLKKYMPHTRWTFLIATITIAGILPFSGFWSKDEILVQAHHSVVFNHIAPWLGLAIYIVGSITALCTAFYMFRLYFLTFEGDYRGNVHPHESPPEMTIPLWILAIMSIAVAALGLPWHNIFEHFTNEAFARLPVELPGEGEVHILPFIIALLIAWGGFFAAWSMYGKGFATSESQDPLERAVPRFYKLSENKFYVDEIYNAIIIRPLWALARVSHRVIDAFVIDKVFVNGAAWFTSLVARLVSPFENGDLSRYAALTALAVVGLIVWAVI